MAAFSRSGFLDLSYRLLLAYSRPYGSHPCGCGVSMRAHELERQNLATAADITQKLSLSKSEADAIVAYRDKNGKFKEIANLKQVPGVDPAKIEAAKGRIEF
jgi:competence ComEA-like helix-hairpin-helix protein